MTTDLLVIVILLLGAVVAGQRMERVTTRRDAARMLRPKVKDHTYTEGGLAVRAEPWGAGNVCTVCGNLADACKGRK